MVCALDTIGSAILNRLLKGCSSKIAEKLELCSGHLSGTFFYIRSPSRKTFDFLLTKQKVLVRKLSEIVPDVIVVVISFGTLDVQIPVYLVTRNNWSAPLISHDQFNRICDSVVLDTVSSCITTVSGRLLVANSEFMEMFPELGIGESVERVHVGRSTYLKDIVLRQKGLISSEALIHGKAAPIRINGRLLYYKGQFLISSTVFAL